MNGVGWGLFLAALLVGWSLLDGAVQGGGQLARPVAGREDTRRRTALATVAPYLLLGEVWLVAAAGVLLAAFGHVEAELWATGYPLVVALLCAWVVRDAALWLRSRLDAPQWRAGWDVALEVASLALPAAFGGLLGVAWVRFGGTDADAASSGPAFDVLTAVVPVLLALLCVVAARVHGGLVVVQRAPNAIAAAARRRVRAALVPAAGLATAAALAALGLASFGATTSLVAAGVLLAVAAVALAARFELDRGVVTHPVLTWVGSAAVAAPVIATAAAVGPRVVGAAAPAQVLYDLTPPVLAAAVAVVVVQAFAWRVLLRPLGPRTVVFF